MLKYRFTITFFSIFFLAIVVCLSKKAHSKSGNTFIRLVLLYDDVSSRSRTDVETRVIELFANYNLPCAFGIIPHVSEGEWGSTSAQDVIPLTAVKAQLIKTALSTRVVEPVLHGYSHQALSIGGNCGHSEFCGQDYDSQHYRVAQGKVFLEQQLDTSISTFYPTWNSYDHTTIRVLEDLNFKTFFGMEYGYSTINSPLNFLPFTCTLPQLRHAIRSARRIPDNQSIIVVLLRPNNFLANNKTIDETAFEEFRALLGWITAQKDIQVRTIEQSIREIDDLSSRRFKAHNSYLKLSHYLYPLIPSTLIEELFPLGVYLSSNMVKKMQIKLCIIVLILYLSILILTIITAFLTGLILFSKSRVLASTLKYCLLAVFIFFFVYSLFRLNFSFDRLFLETTLYSLRRNYYRLTILTIAALGSLIGVCLSLDIAKERHR